MTNCPSQQELRLFLDEKLADESVVEQIVLHLENCIVCQQQLEEFCPPISTDTFTGPTDESVERLIDELVKNPPKPEPALLIGKKLGVYEIQEPIGWGTSGIVYCAEDTRLKRRVAVKVLKNDFTNSDRARTRLDREARAAASLKHQNIVGVHDVEIDPIGCSYLVMELVEGGTLKQLIRSKNGIAPRQACGFAKQILQGLEAAHQKGLVHRDLKSSNVLLKLNEPNDPNASEQETAKLADFGLVRELDSDSNLTRENVIAGTPAYMSPEQVLSPHDVDHRADIYSLGVVLYEMLAGELPFRGIDRMVLKQVVHDDPRPLCRINDTIPRDLETICSKALSKKADSRYATAREMRDDLQRWSEGRPIKARRIGVIGKAWNWANRNPTVATLVALSCTLLTLLAVGSTINTISIRRASLEKDRFAVAARRQRDQSLETIRKLIFEVNELLEPGELNDLDETQARLLNVALEGIERIDKTGEEAGIADESTLAAKNRLGDVYYRLGELEKAKTCFESVIQLADSIDSSDQRMILEERLRAYEGLVSYAQDQGTENTASQMRTQADLLAQELGSMIGQDVTPSYYSDIDFRLEPDEIRELIESLADMMESPPKNGIELESATSVTQSLAWHFIEEEQFEDAKRHYEQLLAWLTSPEISNEKLHFRRTLKSSQHHAYYGLSEIALNQDDSSEYIQMLRKSIDVLPRTSDGDRFVPIVEDDATQAIYELTMECDSLEPSTWMVKYFEYDVSLSATIFKDFPTDRRLEFANYESQARLIWILDQTGEKHRAQQLWGELQQQIGPKQLKSNHPLTEDLLRELSRLEMIGYSTEQLFE